MKKNNKLIFLLLILFLPIFVKADMAAPMSSYEVRISNPEGAETYKWNGETNAPTGKKLNYDEVYEVRYEIINNNEMYVDVNKKTTNEDGSTSYSELIRIKLKDTKPLEVKLEDHKKETKMKYYVFDDSCYLYNGPSQIYGKISPEISLSIGTIIEVEYYDDMWAYVEYNGYKGWVYTYTYRNNEQEYSGMVNINNNYRENIITVKNVVMYKSPKTDEELGVVIPKEETLNVIYTYSMIPRSPIYYVEYNGTRGWIKPIEEKDNFSEDTNYNQNVITNIAYEYNGTSEFEVINENGVTFYSEINNKNSNIGIIPYKTKFIPILSIQQEYRSNWYMIEYNGAKGWIYDNYKDISSKSTPEEKPTTPIAPEPTPEEEDENIESSINEKVIYYIVGAIILSLTSIVTILLINKKKKEKNATK